MAYPESSLGRRAVLYSIGYGALLAAAGFVSLPTAIRQIQQNPNVHYLRLKHRENPEIRKIEAEVGRIHMLSRYSQNTGSHDWVEIPFDFFPHEARDEIKKILGLENQNTIYGLMEGEDPFIEAVFNVYPVQIMPNKRDLISNTKMEDYLRAYLTLPSQGLLTPVPSERIGQYRSSLKIQLELRSVGSEA